jgi:DNA-binding beta-propeller fold protein YncE
VLDEATLLAETARHGGRPSAQTCLWNFGVFGGEVSAAAIPGPAWLTSTLVLPGAMSAGEEGIAVNPATGRVYVTDGPGDRLFILQDGPTAGGIAFVTSVAVGDNPQGVAVNLATNKVYVANARSAGAPYGTLTVIDGATHAILKTVDLVGP